MSGFTSRLQQNVHTVEQRILEACFRAGRPRAAVTLVAVTKYAAWEWVEALVELGQKHLGENRPQQLADRARQLTTPVTWHLIGHLQSNKAKLTLPIAPWIHSIDSLKLLALVDRLAGEMSLRPRLLLEVNITGEATKYGFTPDELIAGLPAVDALQHVDVAGLMTMAPASDDPEDARPAFRNLRLLRDRLHADSKTGLSLPYLSMGMTGDFEVAIEEGATFVRVGSALFEGLAPT